MAKSNNNLFAVIKDVADAIKSKTGSEEKLTARDFPDAIGGIDIGGGDILTLVVSLDTF